MSLCLVDTSVWIEVLRRTDPLDLNALVPIDDVVTCLPVIQEVLQGIGQEAPFRVAREALFAMTVVEDPMSRDLFEHAVELYRNARRHGLTVRSSVDCLIAATALRHDLEVLHRDRDYTALARVSRLRCRHVDASTNAG